MAVASSRGPNSFYSLTNPPPDAADPLALTAFNPTTWSQAGTLSTAISTGTTRVPYSDTRLTYQGATEFSVGATAPDTALYESASVYPHNRASQQFWGVEFFTNATFIELQIQVRTFSAYRLKVNNRRVTESAVDITTLGVAANGLLNIRFDFGTATPRRISFEFDNVGFNGVFLPTAASLWKVPTYTERTLILGDSISGGSGNNIGLGIGTWIHRAALLLGWQDPWNQSFGAQGYTVGTPTFVQRATGSVTGSTGNLNDIGQYGLAGGLTRVIIWGGINDTSTAQATISTAANTLYQNIKAALPAATLYVIGCFSSIGATTVNTTNTDETLRVAAAAQGIAFISPVTGKVYNARGSLISDQGQWITATNQGTFIGADGVHPTDDGFNYIARRVASAFASIAADIATIGPWAGGLHAAIDNGEPSSDKEWIYLSGQSTLATLTPTALTTTTARCWSYNCMFPIVVNRIRWYGIGATTTHQIAVYRQSDGVRVIGQLALTTTADAWNSVAVPAVTLAANTPYIFALSTTATGTTAGLRTGGTPLLFPPLQASTPGGLALAGGDHRFWFGQFAVTTGALPATLPTLVRGTGWTAGLPLFFFDSNSAA